MKLPSPTNTRTVICPENDGKFCPAFLKFNRLKHSKRCNEISLHLGKFISQFLENIFTQKLESYYLNQTKLVKYLNSATVEPLAGHIGIYFCLGF